MKINKNKKRSSNPIVYPMKLVAPVASFLTDQLNHLKSRRNRIVKEDPFADVNRISDNAAPDADAEEQFGHARMTAMKDLMDRKIIQTRRALTQIKIGRYGICENCGKMIDTDRLTIYPEATLCIDCEAKKEKK